MLENQLSRYGAISRVIPNLAPGAKVFLVSDSDDTTVGPLNLGAEFASDKDGVTRVYTTIQAAVNACAAGRGDVVLVLPNYDNSLGRADSWNVAAVTIMGLGYGGSRPTVRYGAATDLVGITANNVWVNNIRFLADADSIAMAVDIDTGFTGVKISNCKWDFDSSGQDFRVMLRVGSRRTTVENNEFTAQDTAGAGRAISLLFGDASHSIIRNNFIYGQFDTVGDTSNGAAAIAVDSTDTSDTNLSGMLIDGNTIVSTDTAAALLMRIGAGTLTARGIVSNNRFATYDTATADTAQVDFGGLLPLNNQMITGDSDVQQSIVGTRLMRGVLDSG